VLHANLPSRSSRRGRAWAFYLIGSLLVSASYFVLPKGEIGQAVVFVAIEVISIGAIVAGVRWWRPAKPAFWYLLGAGQLIYLAGNATWYLYPVGLHGVLPYPSVADALFITSYIVSGVALVLLIRSRSTGAQSRADLIDTAIIGLGLASVSWTFLIAPALNGSTLGLAGRLTSIAYPLLDITLLSLAIRLAVTPGARMISHWLVLLWIAGQFAADYMSNSQANGYIPVFTWYELLQSTPSTGANESDRDFSNLNNAGTMNAYYANFKLLMQKAGAFGKQVVVHVEPDLWAYLQQRAGSGDASTLTASVANSGFADVATMPNTVQGFAWALLHLRDLYAPNAVLGIHASVWSAGVTNPDATAAFLNSAGISANTHASTWDVVVSDVDDHDAGWWEQNGSNRWWAPTDFTAYLAWVAELKAKTGRQQIVWQVPVGNQYYLTMNNTCGHYQDNVAPYFLAHPADLSSAGLIAVLFGGGNPCTTQATDAVHDGVTNNNGVPTSDAAGGCNACNTHTSTVSDDDGGFLRTFVGQYYAGPPPPPPPRPASPPQRLSLRRCSASAAPSVALKPRALRCLG